MRVKGGEPGSKTTYSPFPGYEEQIVGSTTTRRDTDSLAGYGRSPAQVVGGSNPTSFSYTAGMRVKGGTPGSKTTYSPFPGYEEQIMGSTTTWRDIDGRTEPTANLTDRGYTGHMHHNLGSGAEDIGLVYMAARWYAPTLGRFISADTLIPDPANPQSYNRYSYVENRPSYYTDPSGHCPWCLGAIAGAIGGAVTSYVGQVVSNYQSGGMTLTEALTTDIDPGKIVAGAVGGAIIGGTFGGAAVAAGGGTLAGVGLGQLTMYGAVSGLAAGQASALIEASIHHYDGWDTDINSLIQDAHSLGFFDMETVMIDTVSGAVAGFVAGTSSKLFHSLAKNFGIEPIIRDIDANGNVIQEMYLSKPLERNVFVRFLEILNTLGIERAARYLASQTSALTEEELEQIIP